MDLSGCGACAVGSLIAQALDCECGYLGPPDFEVNYSLDSMAPK